MMVEIKVTLVMEKTTDFRSIVGAALAVVPALLLLGGCAARIESSEKLAHVDADKWASSWDSLPVEVHGTAPRQAGEALASFAAPPATLRDAAFGQLGSPQANGKIVLYVNGTGLPAQAGPCRNADPFRPNLRNDPRVSVKAFLCNGAEPISRVSGSVRLRDQSTAEIERSFGVIEEELFSVLQPPPTAD